MRWVTGTWVQTTCPELLRRCDLAGARTCDLLIISPTPYHWDPPHRIIVKSSTIRLYCVSAKPALCVTLLFRKAQETHVAFEQFHHNISWCTAFVLWCHCCAEHCDFRPTHDSTQPLLALVLCNCTKNSKIHTQATLSVRNNKYNTQHSKFLVKSLVFAVTLCWPGSPKREPSG